MAIHHSCRGCRHGQPPKHGEPGWCRLRQLSIHPDLVGELSCHHWTAREPRLPTLSTCQSATWNTQGVATVAPPLASPVGRQLSLEVALCRGA